VNLALKAIFFASIARLDNVEVDYSRGEAQRVRQIASKSRRINTFTPLQDLVARNLDPSPAQM